MINPTFKQLTLDDKDYYNHFYYMHGAPCSDYCFSVIQTWLAFGGPVEIAELTQDLLIVRYVDVLDTGLPLHNYTLIGNPDSIVQDDVLYLINLVDDSTKVVITEPHHGAVQSLLPASSQLQEEPGLNDYIYSVPEYSTLELATYRNIRRKINAFKRDYPTQTVEVKDLDLNDIRNRMLLVNNHHIWENTFQYGNDPLRTEGIILARSLELAETLGLHCMTIWVDSVLEGFFIYTEVKMRDGKYADVHHARFSYVYENLNDYAFHLLATELVKDAFTWINFERDADVEGLRQYKLLKKPVKIIKNYSL